MNPCRQCFEFSDRLTFASPNDYQSFVRQLITAVDERRFHVVRADFPLERMLAPQWPGGDVIVHVLQCWGCGRGFELNVNVWNGRNWWEPKSTELLPDPTPLSTFATGKITVIAAHVMKMKLEELVAGGLVEELSPPQSLASSRRGTERWFRDTVSNVTYCLIEYFGFTEADDMRWEVVPPAEQGGRTQ
jgi:hypothetical protein